MQDNTASVTPQQWWSAHRWRYNAILLIAAPTSLACLFLVWWLFESRLPCLEITGFSIGFGMLLFGVALALANGFYYLGPLSEILLKPRAAIRFRRSLFIFGTVFSVLLIFSPVVGNLIAASRYPSGAERCMHGS